MASVDPGSKKRKHIDSDLIDSAKEGDLDRVRELLRAGVDVDEKDGYKLLMWASTKGHSDVVRLLLGTTRYS